MIPPFQAKLYIQLAINPIEKIGIRKLASGFWKKELIMNVPVK